jgi:hypothetical protein
MIGITLSWRLRPLGHLTGLNLVDSMEDTWNAKIIFVALMVGQWTLGKDERIGWLLEMEMGKSGDAEIVVRCVALIVGR